MTTTAYSIKLSFFFFVVLLMAVAYPVTGYIQGNRLRSGIVSGKITKSHFYLSSIIWAWIPASVILTAILLQGFSLKDLGFVFPSRSFNIPQWLYLTGWIASAAYFLYNIFCIISFRFFENVREHHAKRVASSIRTLLPVSSKEKRLWRFLSLTAGITEELQYRGYLFFAIPLLFPNAGIFTAIVVSSILFSLGHLYQGKEVIKPAVAGLFLSLIYPVLGSIYPLIILHTLQDFVAAEIFKKPSE